MKSGTKNSAKKKRKNSKNTISFFNMPRQKITTFQKIVYIFFGFSGILAIWKTGFWYGSIPATIFHTAVLIAAVNWGLLGIIGKDIVEWIEELFAILSKAKANKS